MNPYHPHTSFSNIQYSFFLINNLTLIFPVVILCHSVFYCSWMFSPHLSHLWQFPSWLPNMFNECPLIIKCFSTFATFYELWSCLLLIWSLRLSALTTCWLVSSHSPQLYKLWTLIMLAPHTHMINKVITAFKILFAHITIE